MGQKLTTFSINPKVLDTFKKQTKESTLSEKQRDGIQAYGPGCGSYCSSCGGGCAVYCSGGCFGTAVGGYGTKAPVRSQTTRSVGLSVSPQI